MAQKTCVLDTSVVVKWCANEFDSADAIMLLEHVRRNHIRVVVPDLLLHELSNSLRWNQNFNEVDVNDALKAFLSLCFEIIAPYRRLLEMSVGIAYAYNCTVYDALFLAIAKENNCILVTADAKFTKQIKNERIMTIKEFVIKN